MHDDFSPRSWQLVGCSARCRRPNRPSRHCWPYGRGLLPAQRLDPDPGRRACNVDGHAPVDRSAGRQSARAGGLERLQPARAGRGGPGGQADPRPREGHAKLVRAGHDRAQDKVWWSGVAPTCCTAIRSRPATCRATGPDEPDESKRSGARARGRSPLSQRSDIVAQGDKLYSLDIYSGTIREVDLAGKAEDRTAKIGIRPYDVVIARNGSRLYVSDWAGRAVLAVDPADLHVVARISAGEHPNQLALHPNDDRLFVACASSNCVSVIDTRRGIVTETIMTTLFPKAPEGSTPDALAVSPDGETLFVANADNNCVAVDRYRRARTRAR